MATERYSKGEENASADPHLSLLGPPTKGHYAMKRITPAQKAQARREQRLADIAEQQADGRLVVRQMSAEERERYPVRERTSKSRARKP